MAIHCQWDCHCWDCTTDRRNSIRFALIACFAMALAGGALVAYQVQHHDFASPDEDPAEVVAVS